MRTLPPVGGSHTPDPWVRALRGMPEYCTFGQLQGMLRGDALLGTRSLHAAFSARDVIRDRRDA